MMGVTPRQALAGLAAAGAAGAILLLPAIYAFGLLVGPPRPVAEAAPAPTLLGNAIWARAGGGSARQLRPIDQLAVAHLFACLLMAPGENDNERIRECRHVIPGLAGLEYFSTVHVTDHGLKRASFIGGHGAFATTLWVTRSWSRDQLVSAIAARGTFGLGWRGGELAARNYFGLAAASLSLPQAALLASRLGDAQGDPWCEPEAAASSRNRVLEAMRDGGAISDAEYQQASIAPLGLASPPEGRPPCRD